MSSDTKGRVREWIGHIIENSERIEEYVAGQDYAAFAANRIVVDAVERCLERIIEASIRIGSDRMRQIAPELPLDKMRGLGNRLRHEYDVLDRTYVWDTVVDELPALRRACEAALRAPESSE